MSQVFPDVAGRDLAGHEYRLPSHFPAVVTIAVIAFKQWHQGQVDAWISRLAAEGIPQTPLGRSDLDRVILELPVLSGRYQLARRFIDGGMAAAIRVPAAGPPTWAPTQRALPTRAGLPQPRPGRSYA